MDDNSQIIDWDQEEKRLQEEYKQKLSTIRKRKEEHEMIGKVLTKGMLPGLVMSIVYQNPSNGNEIATKIAEITLGAWQPSTGGIYPILKRLEKNGYVTSEWSDPDKRTKKIYSMTDKGNEEFAIQKNILERKMLETISIFQRLLESLHNS